MKLGLSFLLYLSLSVLPTFGQTPPSGYQIGDVVQDFELPSVSGQNVSLSQYAEDKGVIVIFLSNTCPYVKLYEERIAQVHETYAAEGYQVLAICSNDIDRSPGNSFEKMKEYHSEKQFAFEYVRDADQQILRQFGATKTPEVFLLQRQQQEFVLRYKGAIDDNPRNGQKVEQQFLADAIAAVEAGKAPDPAETKSIGCGIRPPKEQ